MSILVCVHLFAILTAVSSFSNVNFPAPWLAVMANKPMRPYLQFTFLNNAYRFFAPNPGTPTVLWFRIQYQDRSVRWVELPGESSTPIRSAYQRRLNLSILLGQHLLPDPDQQGKLRLTPQGSSCLESCVRHVAHTHARDDAAQTQVKSVGVYIVGHAVILPEQVRAGWQPTDLRTYHPIFVGAFTASGERIDELRPGVLEQPIHHFAAGVLQTDVYPQLRDGHGDPRTRLEELSLPGPVHRFMTTHPELLDPNLAGPGLQARIETLLAGG